MSRGSSPARAGADIARLCPWDHPRQSFEIVVFLHWAIEPEEKSVPTENREWRLRHFLNTPYFARIWSHIHFEGAPLSSQWDG